MLDNNNDDAGLGGFAVQRGLLVLRDTRERWEEIESAADVHRVNAALK